MEQEFIKKQKEISDKYQESLPVIYKRANGIYYTGVELASILVQSLFEDRSLDNIHRKTFLEPAVGTGDIVFAYLEYVRRNKQLSLTEAKELIYNIYVCDSDHKALSNFLKQLEIYAENVLNFQLDIERYKKNMGGALLFDISKNKESYISIEEYFPGKQFDIIITNPPYKNLRAEKRQYESLSEYEEARKYYQKIKDIAKEIYLYSTQGTANIYKYFLEEIFTNYSHKGSMISLLVPTSILKDQSNSLLRKVVTKEGLFHVVNIPERNRYIKAKQALSILNFDRQNTNKEIVIQKDINNPKKEAVSKSKVISSDPGSPILILGVDEYEVLDIMNRYPKLKDFKEIVNFRGELDVSLDKRYITSSISNYKLIRGRNLKHYFTDSVNVDEYVSEEFIKKSSKSEYINEQRIACQQVVNMNKDRRLIFSTVPPKVVLANSCNFIYVKPNKHGIDQYFLLGILNSEILNWYFKVYSSNNHVSNYELDNLPIPACNTEIMKEISRKAKLYEEDKKIEYYEEVEYLVRKLFGLDYLESPEPLSEESFVCSLPDDIAITDTNMEDFALKVKEGIQKKQDLITKGIVMNNKHYSLSKLDLEIIKSVKPGGNWRDIPQSTMNKSKRLLGIQRTGGRTTLYGRLSYEAPSYTVTTYFNRPGNGTYIHPVHDRVLTTREAARLQGFPDDYLFLGNQRDILNQIGNAIPPHIGYLFGAKLKNFFQDVIALDLFSGAGGFLTGMSEAKVEHVLAVDIDKSALMTLNVNHPSVPVYCADITKKETKKIIINIAKEKDVNVISGGPPCQGFSLAGYRDPEDSRNKLFKDFVDIVKEVKPKVFIFENVVGLLSSNKGQTYHEIQKLFSQLGYNLKGDTLDFSDYGIPQKRRRVIIVGVREGIGLKPEELYPQPFTEHKKVTVKEAIKDLENLNEGEESIKSDYSSDYIEVLKKKKSYSSYYKNLSNNIDMKSAQLTLNLSDVK